MEKRMKRKSSVKMSKSDHTIMAVIYLFLTVLAISCIIPFLYVIGSSFQTQNDILRNGYRIIPKDFTLETYRLIFMAPKKLIDAYLVTIIITIVGTLAGLWVTATYGYVISRKSYSLRNMLSFFVFFTMLFNGGLVPTYILMVKWLHLKDNLLALIIPGMCSAWNILLMKGFFRDIPESLIESAKMDGGSELIIFSKIVIPISKPVFATIGLFLILGYWNSWYESMLYMDSSNKVSLQYLLVTMMRNIELLNSPEAQQYGMVIQGYEAPTLGARMAMAVLATGPIVFVFLTLQKYFISGITVGAVKE
mgnify:CR=1 FL=1